MRLYSIQPLPVVHALFVQGELFAQPAWLDDPEERKCPWGWDAAYQWMVQQMRCRIRVAQKMRYPFWAYYWWSGAGRARPDLRSYTLRSWASENRHVLLELEVPEDEVLLSCYSGWHFVLNYWHMGTPREVQCFEKAAKRQGLDFYRNKPLPDADLDAQLRKSWELIFDTPRCARRLELQPQHQCIQATFSTLRVDQVQRATIFGGLLRRKIECRSASSLQAWLGRQGLSPNQPLLAA